MAAHGSRSGLCKSAHIPDKVLVERFLSQRDERDFRILHCRFTPALAQIVLRFVRGNHADAEEVLQTTWIRAVRGMPGFRWESSLKSWLTGIALNCSREHLRRERRHDSTEPIDHHDLVAPARPPREISRVELERAIARLPDGYREVLILHDIQGYTHLEIGGILGVEEGTSKSQLFRARRAIRSHLTSRETRRDCHRNPAQAVCRIARSKNRGAPV